MRGMQRYAGGTGCGRWLQRSPVVVESTRCIRPRRSAQHSSGLKIVQSGDGVDAHVARASTMLREAVITNTAPEPRIESLAGETRETHVLMNNCYQDFAVRNGRELGDLLSLDLRE